MLTGPLYPNQPLVDVATEVRFRGDLRVESIRPRFHRKIRNDFPQLMVPGAEQGVAPALQHYRFENDRHSHGMQLAVHSFSYYSRDYPGHDAFLETTSTLLEEFVRLIGELHVNRIGWRYINAIPFARESGLVPLHRFFGHIFGMELSRKHHFASVDFRATLPTGNGRLNMALKSGTSKDVPQEESLLLDIDAFRSYQSQSMDAESIMNEVRTVHSSAYNVFEALITDDYRAYLLGGENG